MNHHQWCLYYGEVINCQNNIKRWADSLVGTGWLPTKNKKSMLVKNSYPFYNSTNLSHF